MGGIPCLSPALLPPASWAVTASYYTKAAVISIDVNPGIEPDINRWGKVVGQNTYGEESETVLQTLR
ncbi:MAG: hypothetical protein ACLR0U_00310 [Enterocloster clostridioformis]